MKNKRSKLAVVFLSTLIIGACGNGENNTSAASSSESEVSSETTQGSQAYQKMYDDALALYEAGKYSEASGSIGLLLQNDLSDQGDLETQAKELQEKINTAQVEAVKEDESYSLIENSKYKTERDSVIIGEKFAAETGKDIKEATDEEIEAWLAEQETVQTEPVESSEESTESTETEAAQSESSSSESETESSEKQTTMTPEEEQIYVLEQVIAKTGISPQDNQFFTSKINDTTYQVEIRHSHEVDGVGISNMVGMYQYDLATEKVQKMDPITGEYQPVK